MKVVHLHKATEKAIRIDRATKWGNPFSIGKDGDREEVIRKHREWIIKQDELMSQIEELKGKDLACWCAPKPCHGDTLLKLANEKG